MQIYYSDEHKKRLSRFGRDSRFDLFGKRNKIFGLHFIEKLADGSAQNWMDKIGGDFCQREEHEGAFVQAFVREDERRRVKDQVIIEQDVDIDQPWPPAESRLASNLDFGLLQFTEEGFGREPRPRLDGHVEEGGLIGVAPGRSLKDPRNSDQLNVGRKRVEGRAQVGKSVPEIGPDGEEDVMFHVAVNISRFFETRFFRKNGFLVYTLRNHLPMEDA
jgi:hypothetical protein